MLVLDDAKAAYRGGMLWTLAIASVPCAPGAASHRPGAASLAGLVALGVSECASPVFADRPKVFAVRALHQVVTVSGPALARLGCGRLDLADKLRERVRFDVLTIFDDVEPYAIVSFAHGRDDRRAHAVATTGKGPEGPSVCLCAVWWR